ncbi:hypothetical protein NDU88_004259 [Pleurodeles waltl]|uniref:Epiplakin n=1 Tax=Pleurodeles waltl TaxID=8319 RepID=A0AAV7V0R4_PLEWA|nr:hypothetical protein NDU88_004259 [Pleurodeles waltl]
MTEEKMADAQRKMATQEIGARGGFASEEDLKNALESIKVQVNVGEFKGKHVSVWDLLHSSYINEGKRQELLKNYRLTVKEIITIVTRTIDDVAKTEIHLDEEHINKFKSVTVEVRVGEYKEQKVTLWELLNSKYISEKKRKELLKRFQAGEMSESELIKIITTIIVETEERSSKLKFKGLRRQVTASELLTSEIIDQKTLTELTQGSKTVEEVTQMDVVKRYLEGTSCIAGVFVPSKTDPGKKEKMSIYKAMSKRFLRPGTALVLLEAQAATGFIIDPLNNKKLSVDEALAAEVIDKSLYPKLLSAERGVTGYTDPYTGQKISLFQAMNKELIVKDHGIRLLEAQIATGGIIDPVHSHRVPVEVAYKRGYFDEEMNQILSDPSDDTKGFFDPNTHENLTYMQLLERCVRDSETGLYMLDVVQKGAPKNEGGIKSQMFLKNKFTHITSGHFQGKQVSVWELINYYYTSEEKRQEILKRYESGTLTIDELTTNILTIIRETENKSNSQNLNGTTIDGVVSNENEAGNTQKNITSTTVIIQQNQVDGEKKDTSVEKTAPQFDEKDQINRALQFINIDITAGDFQGQRKTVWDLLHSTYTPEDKRNDHLKRHKTAVEEIINSLITTIEKKEEVNEIIKQDQQECTSAHPTNKEDVPQVGDIEKALRSITVDVKVGRYKGQKVTVWELLHSEYITDGQREEMLKNYKLTVKEIIDIITRTVKDETDSFFVDQETTNTLTSLTTDISVGEYKGQKVSVWVLLNSKYISDKKRKELLKRFQAGEMSESELIKIITTIIVETEERSSKLKFKGLRRQVTASELLTSEIIDQKTLTELTQGSKTVEEVTQMDVVKRYLEGTSCIAGVFVPSKTDPGKKEKMSIYQAMWKGFLRPGTALVLLEAQAATGFIIDPLNNRKLSVDEALAAEVIDQSLYPKLLSAERGVTGYTDPYSGQKISLFQAMNKELIVKDHGIRLLEAQIATGGIIDPVHSHRVPVEVAYKRGYFDEEINQILSDPSDDTKGFFDPNSHENLTYMQLLERCVRDSETGLYLLDVSVWELINYYYTSEEKRQEILKRYESGTLTIDELITSILIIIKETENKSDSQNLNGTTIDGVVSNENEAGNTHKNITSTTVIIQQNQVDGEKKDTSVKKTAPQFDEKDQINRALQFINIDISAGDFQGQRKTVWDLLHSKYTPEDKRNDHLKRHKTAVEEIINSLITTIEKKEEVNEIIKQDQQEGTSAHPTNKEDVPQVGDIEKALRSITVDVKVGRYKGQKVTVWDLLHSEYITDGQREEMLKNYKLTVKEIIDIITRTVNDETDSFFIDQETSNTLTSLTTDISVGEYKGQKVSVWVLLNSKYISEKKRKELLKRFQAGEMSESEIIKIITTIIVETEERSSKLKFKGLRRQVTASELLTSEIIDQKTLTELTQGSKTVEEVTQMDVVKRYLEGTSCIAGVFVPSKTDPGKKEKMSIYKAMSKRFLRPGTALVLLEAQAATGFIIDPLNNKKLSVDEALAADVIDQSLYPKLLSAERGVTGYTDPYSGQKISLFQAMNKELIVKDHGIRLLEAQIATGGIIDPVHSHRVPVEVAYKRGYFDEEMNQILSDPSDDTKGFFDPNTHENLTYMQLLERCVLDSETGLYMLDVVEKGAPKYKGGIKSLMFLKNKFTQITSGHFQGKQVSVWELINYYYTSEEKRQEILKRYESGTLTIDELITNILTIIRETENKSDSQNLNGTTIDGVVSNENEAGNTQKNITSTTVIIQQNQVDGEKKATSVKKTAPQFDDKDQINRALQFINIDITAGDFQGQRKTVWDLLHSTYTPEDKRNDHLKRHKTAVEEIINSLITTIEKKEEVNEIIKQDQQEGTSAHPTNKEDVPQVGDIEKALLSITVDVKVGRYKGQKVTVWDLLHSEYITDGQREEMLKNYKLTVKEIIDIITRTVNDETDSFFVDQEKTNTLTSLTTDISVGEYKGQKVSVWVLLNSKYISDKKRKELLKRFQAGEMSESELIKIITTIIVETEERSSKLKFKGLRRQVTASELLTSEIIDQKTLTELTQGSKTVEEVTQMDVVKRYLEGTSCIAGVFVPSKTDPGKKEIMSIYKAMSKRFLRPGTALVLLEAQAATGFIIDPLNNKKLSVDEALAAEVIDQSLYPKLLSAERGVTGYTDPYSGQKISLFQAMNKELIVKDHGIRLLEAQIATGGIIDPVHSHRVPVEVAYKRGYFDEEMNQILSDPSDDTKGFFDPNTHENLTYMQLLERCVLDSETGLYMLDVVEKGAPKYEGGIKSLMFLKNKFTHITSGHFQGKQVSVWELINYYYTSEEKRQEILKRYESGTLTIDELITNILTIIKETGNKSDSQNLNGTTIDGVVSNENEAGNTQKNITSTTVIIQQNQVDGEKKDTSVKKTAPQFDEKDQINRALQFINIDISAGDFQGQRKTVWDLLHSKYTPEDKRNDHLKRHKTAVEEIINSLITTIEKKEEVNEIIKQDQQEGTSAHPTNKEDVPQVGDIEKALRSITVDVKVGRYKGQKVTVWDLLHSEYITDGQREEMLKNYKLTVKEIIDIITRTVKDETDSFFVDQETTNTLTSLTTDISVGEYKGQKVSVWVLLNSKYISDKKRKELLKRFQAGEMSESELIKIITTIIVETEERSSKLKFKGLRRQVTASELLTSEIIDQKTLTELTQGSKTVEEVTQMDVVKRYLEGTSCIAGVFVPSKTDPGKKEKMSIYKAMSKRFLRPGTALVLLEAQAATGFIIDPLNNKKLSVDEALAADVIDQSLYPKLLSAERGVTGYTDPYSGQKISLFQAMNKELIVKDHGIRLLEAQIATGGIIDPVHSHRVPVEVAYKRGYFDEEMNQILSDPSDDTKGFFDPNTHENLTYMQLLERCVLDSETGLYMLDVVEKGAPKYEGGIKSLMFLKNKFTHITSGHFQGKQVSVWELINYYYTSEEKRQEILKRYESGTLIIDELITNILTIIKETGNKSDSQNLNGTTIDGVVSNENEAGNTQKNITSTTVIIQQNQVDGEQKATSVKKTAPQFDEKDQINRALQFINIDITAGDFQGQRKTVWDLLHSKYTPEDKQNDHLKRHKTAVEEIINSLITTIEKKEEVNEIIKQDQQEGTSAHPTNKKDVPQVGDIEKALRSITVDVKVGRYKGQKVTVWDLLHSEYITDGQREELLKNYKLTVKEIIDIITRTVKDETDSFFVDQETTNTLTSLTTDISVGEYKGQKVSVWVLLNSKYISDKKRKELLKRFQAGEMSESELIKIITTIIVETEERSSKLKFKGLRRQVTASELLTSEIIDQKTLTELTQGSKTVEEVTQMDVVKRYLEGTSCIAGVFVPSKTDPGKKEKMSIYKAMSKRFLRPGTALVLLEAQAATGFIIDPLNNKKLSVDEALAAEVIDQSLYPKLLSAERGVTGYTDPYSGQKISLFQAMNKELIVKDHGIRLLEAQIATGGIIDPVHSHRVPVEVAYKRGYFDEEMNQILSDPSDDTKGFFDPNTHENLTYMQLLERCVLDSETGLYMLDVVEKGAPKYEGGIKSLMFLKNKFTHITSGHYQGKQVSVWELINYYYTSEEKRQEILKRYESGTLTIDELITNILTIIKETENKSDSQNLNGTTIDGVVSNENEAGNTQKNITSTTVIIQQNQVDGEKKATSVEKTAPQFDDKDQINRALQFINIDITAGDFQGQRKTVWDLLHSKYTPEDKRNDHLKRHKTAVEEIINSLITTIEKKEEVNEIIKQDQQECTSAHPTNKEDVPQVGDIEKALRSITVDVKVGRYKGQKVTVWDLLHSEYITDGQREEMLKNYKLTVKEIIDIITRTVNDETDSFFVDQEKTNTLTSLTTDISVGEYKGQKVSVWVLLNSKYISDKKRKELLKRFQAGEMSESELIKIITTIIVETEERSSKLKFKGLRRQVTASELLTSEIIDQKTLTELTQGSKTVEEVTQMDVVKRYLEGTSCIAGVFVPSKTDPGKKEKMSIYKAMSKRFLRPGTALVLLEAQAATGFIIDPLNNKKLSVDEALAAEVIDQSLYPKLLSAERGVTGYTDPYSGQKISLFQAMNKELIVKDHGIRLLEAQIATGGIIDPVHSHRVPVEVAYKRGYFDEEMNQILSDPSDDTKGFFDPNTHENLTYMQLLERCVLDSETGLYMLDVVEKGAPKYEGAIKSLMFLKNKFTHITSGHYQGKQVSVWELINYYYTSEEKRQEILKRYESGTLTIDELITNILTIIKETGNKSDSQNLNGTTIDGVVSNENEAGNTQKNITSTTVIIQQNQVDGEKKATSVEKTAPQFDDKDQINRALQFINIDITAGDFQGQRKTVWDLLHSKYTPEDKRNDHLKRHKTAVEEIINSLITTIEKKEEVNEIIKQDQQECTSAHPTNKEDVPQVGDIEKALRSITVDVKVGRYKGQKVTVWDLLHSEYITDGQREEMLKNYKLTVKEIIDIITRTVNDETDSFFVDQETTNTLTSLTTDISVGEYKGQKVSVWVLLNSKYISDKKRKELLKRFQAGGMSESELIKIITTIIVETEERSSKLKFKGLRRQVTASELLTLEIIDQKTLTELTQGSKTVEEVTQMDVVKRYLEGTSCIAGVFVPSKTDPGKKEKMSIYEAMWKGFLRPGTALVLLEAQAATGFIIDPLNNRKLSVDEALAADVIDQSLYPKLLSAERGVTGYTDPYSGQKISLFQAMNKELIVKDHGIRLLEAQIATGGIIDPVHSHRVPVEVAYKRGYFDEEMNQILSDPSDDTKGFFDPNTHENLTYMQLLERCVLDSETGLYLLDVLGKGAPKYEGGLKSLTFLKNKFTHITSGHFQGKQVSVWELINYYYTSEEKRQEILKRYESGTLTIDELITNILTIIKETEQKNVSQTVNGTTVGGMSSNKNEAGNTQKNIKSTVFINQQAQHNGKKEDPSVDKTGPQSNEKDQINRALQFINVDITAGDFQGQRKTVWDLLHSTYMQTDIRHNLLNKHKATVEKIQSVLSPTLLAAEEGRGISEETQHALESKLIDISLGEFRGQKLSLWELLNSNYIAEEKRKDLLEKYQSGTITLEQLVTIIITIIEESYPTEEALRNALQDIKINVTEGQIQGQMCSVWDLLHSGAIAKDKRHELLDKCRLTVREIATAVSNVINEWGARKEGLDLNDALMISQLGEADSWQVDEKTQSHLQDTLVEIPLGQFKGQKMSLWDILESTYVSKLKKSEILQKYKSGELTLQEMTKTLVTIIEKTEERRSMLMFKGLRRQVSAAELFTSEIIDKKTLDELTQGSKTLEQVNQIDSVKRYLEGTSCIAGVLLPLKKGQSKREKMSIHQAMQKNILRPGTALVLLEAQAATGFIIDPVQNKKLSVDEAVSAGVVGQDLHTKLLSAERAVTGYRDPYTEKQISLFQAMKKDLIVKDHGIRLLEAQIATGGIIDPVHSHRVPVEVAYKRGYFDEEMNHILSDPSDDTKGFFDPNTHENLTYMQLLERCVQDPETRLYMLDVAEKGTSWFQIDKQLKGLMQSALAEAPLGMFSRENISIWDLFFSRYITEGQRQELLHGFKSGKLTFEQLKTVLVTSIEENKGKVSSKKKDIEDTEQRTEITFSSKSGNADTRISKGKYDGHSESDQDGHRKSEEEIKNTLKYFHVNIPQLESHTFSLWTVLCSKHYPKERKQILFKRYTSAIEDVITILTSTLKETETEHSSLDQKDTAKGASDESDSQTREVLEGVNVKITAGEFKGQALSVWELLHSKYISEEKRSELLRKYKSGELTLEELIRIVTTTIEEFEERSSKLKFKGLRRQVTASELLSSEIIDTKTLTDLTQGKKTLEEVTQMDSVRRYLEGTNCIAGVFVASKKDPTKMEKMSIYEAMGRRILRPGTALVLLEAQAATGFMINPVTNEKLSVDEAVSAGVIGQELHAKLLSAEKAVTGYTDPYTGQKISLFQAMNKDLIVKDHGIRLLEAQIATGGIIDPVQSHRVPVAVAYKRGYFDEEMNQILSDPSDDTKGFFDPNTHENLTYMQLLERGIQDPETGLCLLSVNYK